MESVITVTLNPAIDKSAEVDRVEPEHKLRCGAPRREPGGGGINVSRALKELGGNSKALFISGGVYGNVLEKLLREEGIPFESIPVSGETRENFTVFEERSGGQYRFGMPGPVLSQDEWRAFLDYVKKLDDTPDFLIASGSLPPGVPDDFYAQLADICEEREINFIVDTSGRPLVEASRKKTFLLKPNFKEFGELVGREGLEGREIQDAAEGFVRSMKCRYLVISLGAAGALAVSADKRERINSPAIPIRSKIGAGDSMLAGMVHGISLGLDFSKWARFGVAAGAAAVMTPGTELCRKDDSERLYQRLLSE